MTGFSLSIRPNSFSPPTLKFSSSTSSSVSSRSVVLDICMPMMKLFRLLGLLVAKFWSFGLLLGLRGSFQSSISSFSSSVLFFLFFFLVGLVGWSYSSLMPEGLSSKSSVSGFVSSPKTSV